MAPHPAICTDMHHAMFLLLLALVGAATWSAGGPLTRRPSSAVRLEPSTLRADAVGSEELPLGRRIFCNRALNMEKIQSVGFDLDYTLAEYTRDFDLLAYDGAVRKLIAMGYPDQVKEFVY